MTFVKTALFHKAGEGSGGGGGGDQHNLGWYATESALTTAHPTATDGDWAIVGATDTVWVWDSDSTGWKDTGAAGIELPDQTGNSGKFLTTDGTSPSWGDAIPKTFNNFYYAEWGALALKPYGNSSGNFAVIQPYIYYGASPMVGIGGGYDNLSPTALIGTARVSVNGSSSSTSFNMIRPLNENNYHIIGAPFASWYSVFTRNIQSTDQKPISVPAVSGSMAVQVSTIPTADSTLEGQIYQYVGTTDANYTHGYIYECVSDGGNPATYSWTAVQVQAGGGGSLPSQTGNAGKFLTTDGTDASWGTTINGAYKSVITLSSYTEIFNATDSSNKSKFAISYSTSASSGSIVFRDSDANYKSGFSFKNNGSNEKLIYPITTGFSLGNPNAAWENIYTKKLNNGADIAVPATGGTMVVATPPSADGTYVLKATVSSGVVTVAWVAE